MYNTDTADPVKLRRDQLVNDYLDAKAAIEKHTIVLGQLAEQIVKEIGVGGRHEVIDGVGIRVQAPAAVFNAVLAQGILTLTQYQSICESKPSAKLAEKFLPGVLVDQCKAAGTKPQVRVL